MEENKYIDGLPIWMFKMLYEHGNTIVTKKRLKRMGKDKILEILKNHGYECIMYESRVEGSITKSISDHMIVMLKNKVEFENES